MKRKILTVMALLAVVALTLCGCADTRVDENQNTPETEEVIFPVEPETPLIQRAMNYANSLGSPKEKIASERFVVADYNPEYAFAHQPGFAYFKGKFYATWASGIRDEDSPGQRIVVASSADNCETWSEPVVVADARKGQ